MDTQAIVSARNLNRVYQADGATHPAVRDVSVEVAPGEFIALMGPSGCGKSTLLNMLSGIDRPDNGEVWVAGTRIDRLTETELALFRRRHVGIVFQFFNLIQNLPVLANIELPAQLSGLSGREIRERSHSLMASLEILPLAGKMPGQLSGGQKQRVAIARALINRPSLLLADEPTGALDADSGQAVMRLFTQLNRDGQTIIMVTHDFKVAGHAGRILTMADGRIEVETRPAAGKMTELLLGRKG